MSRTILVLLFGAFLAACSPTKTKGPTEAAAPVPTINHTIQYPGETLGIISKWYTGSASNWKEIREVNPGLEVTRLRVGQTVKVPEWLVTRREALTAEFVSQGTQVVAQAPVASDDIEVDDSVAVADTSKEIATEETVVAEVVDEQDEVASDLAAQGTQGGGLLGAIKSGLLALKAGSKQGHDAPIDMPASADINTQLYNAVLFADAAQVKKLLAEGADPNYRDNDRPLLLWAAQNESVEIVQLLLDGKADINAVDGIGHTALMRALAMEQLPVAKLLIQNKAALDVRAKDGSTALMMAVNNGAVEPVRLLAESGADLNTPDANGNTPAFIAVQYGYNEILSILGNAKADLNASGSYYTPLSYAIDQSNAELVRTLIQLGANPNNKPSSGSVPVLQAVNSPEILKILLEAKADPNPKNDYGQTALMVAVQNEASASVAALVEAGADLNAKDTNGMTALAMAESGMEPQIGELLRKHGAV